MRKRENKRIKATVKLISHRGEDLGTDPGKSEFMYRKKVQDVWEAMIREKDGSS